MSNVMPSADQIRAALGLLRWDNRELAEAAGIAVDTVLNIKMGHHEPQPRIRQKIRRALEAQGVEFLPDDGVKRWVGSVDRLVGDDALNRFFDDVYETVRDGGELCASGVDEQLFAKFYIVENEKTRHRVRMAALGDKIKFRCLLRDGDYNFNNESYIEYRWMPRDHFVDNPVYLYNNKLAFLKFDKDKLEITCIKNPAMAAAFRGQFEFMWAHSKEPTTRKK